MPVRCSPGKPVLHAMAMDVARPSVMVVEAVSKGQGGLRARHLVKALFRLWFLPGGRRRGLLLLYAVLELISYYRFRQRIKRLQLPRCVYRRGTLEDLRWLQRSVEHPVCPVRLNKESMQNFLNECALGRAEKTLTWEHYYVTIQSAFCIMGPSQEEHALLLEIAGGYAKREGLSLPPPRAQTPAVATPVAYGQSPVQVFYKPLPLEVFMAVMRKAADALFWAKGYKGYWLPTSEGWLRYWVAEPREAAASELPVVFVHGVGFGGAPYVGFLEVFRRTRPVLVVELPNCSRAYFQNTITSAASWREALERILGQAFGITKPGRYILMGHSLGTDFCTMIMNDPRMIHADPPIRPARLVLLDPVCFIDELAAAHRLPFWTVRESLARHGDKWWLWPMQVALLMLFIRDEYNQEATKRALVPGTDCVFRCSPALLRRCPTMVCLSGEDQALPAWKVHDYIRAQMPDINVRMHPKFEHGGFLTNLPDWLARSHADDVVSFLDGGSSKGKDMPRVSSLPGGPADGTLAASLAETPKQDSRPRTWSTNDLVQRS